MEFKDRIKALRCEKEITQTELASKFGKTESAVRSWELGRSKPDADTLYKLASYFDCSADYLLGISDYKNSNYMEAIKSTETKAWEKINQLPPRVKQYIYVAAIQLADSYQYLENDEILALTIVEEVQKIVDIIFENCEFAAAILDSGYDSFDLGELPSVRTVVISKAADNGTRLRSICDGLMESLKAATLRQLPGYDPEAETAKLAQTIEEFKAMRKLKGDDNAET